MQENGDFFAIFSLEVRGEEYSNTIRGNGQRRKHPQKCGRSAQSDKGIERAQE